MEHSEREALHAQYLSEVVAVRALESEFEKLVLNPLRRIPGVVDVSWRIKPWEAAYSKLLLRRNDGRTSFGIGDFSDLVGVRVVVIARSVIDSVCALIARACDIENLRHSRGMVAGLVHVTVVWRHSQTASLRPLRFELQVLDEFAHAIMGVEHALLYKQGDLETSTSIGPLAGARADDAESLIVESAARALEGVPRLEQVIEILEKMVADPNVHEKRDVHPFIKENQFLLHTGPDVVVSEPAIGLGTEYRLDFLIREATGDYILVELENPQRRLFTKRGSPTADVTYAVQQVEDWQEWIEQNIQTVQRTYPEMLAPAGLVIIGRSSLLTPQDKQRLARRNINMRGRLKIETYDEVIARARAYVVGVRRTLSA